MPSVSVIVPVFNKEKYIKRTIESVLRQTYKDFELILINDGSTDFSKDILIEYKNKDSRIVLIDQENKGVSSSRNFGIDLAKSKYLSFLDADDEIHECFLEKMLATIEDSNVCCCGHFDVFTGVKVKPKMKFYQGDILEKYIYNKCTPNTNSWLIKKEFLEKYKIKFNTNISWGEDMDFFSRILLHEKNVKIIEEYLTCYHQNYPESLSQNEVNKIYKDIRWMENTKSYIAEHEVDTLRKTLLIRAFESYRIPGAIIYRLNLNLHISDKDTLKIAFKDMEKYTKKIKLVNGLRSIKLYFTYAKLKFHLF